jgi:hypothetical protein
MWSVRGMGVAVREAVLLVDHQQAEIPELDVLGEQAVGPDHDVDPARRELVPDLANLLGLREARQ